MGAAAYHPENASSCTITEFKQRLARSVFGGLLLKCCLRACAYPISRLDLRSHSMMVFGSELIELSKWQCCLAGDTMSLRFIQPLAPPAKEVKLGLEIPVDLPTEPLGVQQDETEKNITLMEYSWLVKPPL